MKTEISLTACNGYVADIHLEQFHLQLMLMAKLFKEELGIHDGTIEELSDFTDALIKERRNEAKNGDDKNGRNDSDGAVCERPAGD